MKSVTNFWVVCVTHLFIEVYFLVQVALIPAFIREFQLTLFEASLVATVPSVARLLMNIPSGFLTDRIKTKYLLSACMAAEGLSALAISQTNSFWMLVVWISVMRLSSPLYHVSGLSSISGTVRQEKMSRSMGFFNAFGNLGAAIGLVSLAAFQSTTGWRWIYVFWSVPILVWSLVLLKSPQPEVAETNEAGRQPILKRLPVIFSTGFLIFLAFVGLREVAHTGTSTFMTTYLVEARGVSEATASLIFGLGPFIGIAGSLIGGYSGEKIGANKALSVAILGGAISLTALASTTQLDLLTLVYLAYSLFANSVWTPMNTIVANMPPIEERGQRFSVYFLIEGVTVSIAPVAVAVVIGLFDIWALFPLSLVFLVASLFTLQILPYKSRSQTETCSSTLPKSS